MKGCEGRGYLEEQKLTGRWPTHMSRRMTTNFVPETVFKYLYAQDTLLTHCHHSHTLQLTLSPLTHPHNSHSTLPTKAGSEHHKYPQGGRF